MNLTLSSPGKDNKCLPRNDSQILEFFVMKISIGKLPNLLNKFY